MGEKMEWKFKAGALLMASEEVRDLLGGRTVACRVHGYTGISRGEDSFEAYVLACSGDEESWFRVISKTTVESTLKLVKGVAAISMDDPRPGPIPVPAATVVVVSPSIASKAIAKGTSGVGFSAEPPPRHAHDVTGRELKEWREGMGLGQHHVAALLHTSRSWISNAEAGKKPRSHGLYLDYVDLMQGRGQFLGVTPARLRDLAERARHSETA